MTTKKTFFFNLFRDQEDADASVQGNVIRTSAYITDEWVGLAAHCYVARLVFEYVSVIEGMEYVTKLTLTESASTSDPNNRKTLQDKVASLKLDIESHITTKLHGLTVRPGRLVISD